MNKPLLTDDIGAVISSYFLLTGLPGANGGKPFFETSISLNHSLAEVPGALN
jgi:hypothetical protein